jgi:hypothetical protein
MSDQLHDSVLHGETLDEVAEIRNI